MGEFQRVEISTSPAELLDTAIETLEAELQAKGVVGWEPNEGDLEIILLGVVANMAASSATVASTVLEAAFRKYGTELFKLTYNEGAAATASTKWKLLEENGEFPAREIEAGFQLEAGGLGFYVEKAVSVAKGTSEVTLTVTAVERGTEYNGLSGVMQPVNSSNFVSEVTIVGETAGGTDQETDEAYMNRLASALELQAPRPITASNFAQMVLDATTGVEVARATAVDGYNPEVTTFEGKVTATSTTMAEVTSFAGISAEKTSGSQTHPGSRLKGPGVAEGTTVVSVNEGAKTLVMSKEATSSPGKKEKYEAIGSYENQRTVTVFVLGPKAAEVTAPHRTTLKEFLEKYRELNFKVFVEPPEIQQIAVKAQLHVLPGYSTTSVVENVETALKNFLSPERWGNPLGTTAGSTTWLNSTEAYGVVRYNQVLGVIENVAGVAYVSAGSTGLEIGLAGGTKGTSDVTLALSAAPLPELKKANLTVSTV